MNTWNTETLPVPDREHLAAEVQHYHAFINLALILAMITSTEIVLIFLPFANWVIVTSLIVLSSVKFVAVILWFMHLIYDNSLLFFLFLSGLLIAAGTAAALMMLFEVDDLDRSSYNAWLEGMAVTKYWRG